MISSNCTIRLVLRGIEGRGGGWGPGLSRAGSIKRVPTKHTGIYIVPGTVVYVLAKTLFPTKYQ